MSSAAFTPMRSARLAERDGVFDGDDLLVGAHLGDLGLVALLGGLPLLAANGKRGTAAGEVDDLLLGEVRDLVALAALRAVLSLVTSMNSLPRPSMSGTTLNSFTWPMAFCPGAMGMFLWAVEEGVTRLTGMSGRLTTTACVAVGRRAASAVTTCTEPRGRERAAGWAAWATLGPGLHGHALARARWSRCGWPAARAAAAAATGWGRGAGSLTRASPLAAACGGRLLRERGLGAGLCVPAWPRPVPRRARRAGSACCSTAGAASRTGAASAGRRRTTKPAAFTGAGAALGLRLATILSTAASAWSSSNEDEWLFTS